MSKKSSTAAPPDFPSDPSRFDLLETKLDKVLAAIGTLSNDLRELSAASAHCLQSLDSRINISMKICNYKSET